eukprot:Hpha_TRINITY_DN15741_c4_g3::TRINITY_DN15741_c4_g3_i1::g.41236::m.41236
MSMPLRSTRGSGSPPPPLSLPTRSTSQGVVEMAKPGQEALVFGLLTTVSNLSGSLGQAISNQVFGAFHPSLSESKNYIADTAEFRDEVARSAMLSYGFSFVALLALPLLPDQKMEARKRVSDWGSSHWYAVCAVFSVGAGLLFTIVIDVLSVIPATRCMQIAGGEGC